LRQRVSKCRFRHPLPLPIAVRRTAIAAAFELLKLVNDPKALRAALEQFADKSAEALPVIDAANTARGLLAEAQAEHQRTLDALTAQQVREHEARLKTVATREAKVANALHQLQADRERPGGGKRRAGILCYYFC
jgi:hypothetical protein